MPCKPNPLKLNKLQLRSLALAQVLADEPGAVIDDTSGDVALTKIPDTTGPQTRIGPFVLPSRDASGFSNPAVWVALTRKGLARQDGANITLTALGVGYATGLKDKLDGAINTKSCGCC